MAATTEGLEAMARQSLYRTYRPLSFDDIVGQQHITQTLRNAVAEGSVAHAYLFSGPRGTGKTTTARILAKALLCEKGTTPEPDATCEACVDIAEGRHPDVNELDAASRTGVDNVREEIIGRVQFAPTRGRYKIYIIDEVHMLSTAAFNALLKTLEEPPEHVVFVLCTTHPQKVPDTIQSRCQRFDFHRIGVDDIADRLRFIAEAEGIRVDRGAFSLIARHAAGGMRDAITTLEQLAAFTGDEVTIDDVEGLLGEVDSGLLFRLAELIERRDIAGGFRFVADFVETGADLAEFARGLAGHIRDLYIITAVDDASGIIDLTAEETSRLGPQARAFGPERLARILDLLGELQAEMRWSSDPRLSLEVALTRMASPRGELTLEALAERIAALETRAASPAHAPGGTFEREPNTAGVTADAASAAGAAQQEPEPALEGGEKASAAPGSPSVEGSAKVRESGGGTAAKTGKDRASEEPVTVEVRQPGLLDRARVKRAWPAVLAEVGQAKPARAHTFAGCEVDLDADGRTLVIEFPKDAEFTMKHMAVDPEMRALLKSALVAVLDEAPPFRYQLGRGAVQPAEPLPPESAAATDVPPDEGESTHSVGTHDPARTTDPAERAHAAAPRSEPVDGSPPGEDDLESFIVHGLGAEIVGETRHDDGEGES